jgi:feruloyl esterase
MKSVLVSLLLSALSPCTTASSSFEQQCLDFRPEQIVAGAALKALRYLPTNTTLLLPGNDATCNRAKQAVATNTCRIVLSIKTSEQSSIVFEAWLPEIWTGRFLASGNGGIDGCEYLHDFCSHDAGTLTNFSFDRHQVRGPCVYIGQWIRGGWYK